MQVYAMPLYHGAQRRKSGAKPHGRHHDVGAAPFRHDDGVGAEPLGHDDDDETGCLLAQA